MIKTYCIPPCSRPAPTTLALAPCVGCGVKATPAEPAGG
jgi:hypothetical protein